MKITSLSRSVHASEVAMENLAGNTQLSKEEKLGEVSRQFEAVMLRQILQSAQQTSSTSKTSGDAATRAIYQDMVTMQLADVISKSGGFGLAQTLKAQLNHEPAASARDPK